MTWERAQPEITADRAAAMATEEEFRLAYHAADAGAVQPECAAIRRELCARARRLGRDPVALARERAERHVGLPAATKRLEAVVCASEAIGSLAHTSGSLRLQLTR